MNATPARPNIVVVPTSLALDVLTELRQLRTHCNETCEGHGYVEASLNLAHLEDLIRRLELAVGPMA